MGRMSVSLQGGRGQGRSLGPAGLLGVPRCISVSVSMRGPQPRGLCLSSVAGGPLLGPPTSPRGARSPTFCRLGQGCVSLHGLTSPLQPGRLSGFALVNSPCGRPRSRPLVRPHGRSSSPGASASGLPAVWSLPQLLASAPTAWQRPEDAVWMWLRSSETPGQGSGPPGLPAQRGLMPG